MTMTEEDKGLLDGHDGSGLSIQTWEEACAESQAWANKARRKAHYRRLRRRAMWIVLVLLIIAFIAGTIYLWMST